MTEGDIYSLVSTFGKDNVQIPNMIRFYPVIAIGHQPELIARSDLVFPHVRIDPLQKMLWRRFSILSFEHDELNARRPWKELEVLANSIPIFGSDHDQAGVAEGTYRPINGASSSCHWAFHSRRRQSCPAASSHRRLSECLRIDR